MDMKIGVKCWDVGINWDGNVRKGGGGGRPDASRVVRKRSHPTAKSCFGKRIGLECMAASQQSLVPFPQDYVEAMKQAQEATKRAIEDGITLLEVEFPTSSLASVAGDAEGANEMTLSSQYMRQFTRLFLEDAQNTRIYFPDYKELAMQKGADGIWSETKFQLDYLTKPNGLLDIGIDISRDDPSSRMEETDKTYIVAYPSFDPRELVAADKVWQKAHGRPFVFFNGELDRLRSDYYPALFYPQMARLSKELIPNVTSAYYIHNFKGAQGGVLFRVYPGPWQVLLRLQDGGLWLAHWQETRPSLKEVALEIIPQGVRKYMEERKGE